MTLADYKSLFFKSNILHFNNGGLSPISRPVFEEINHWTKCFYEQGFHSDAAYKARMKWTREQISHLIDCEPDEVAFFQSCAWAISQFAFGLNLQLNDEVLIFDQEYASNLYPWQAACQRSKAKLVILDSGEENEVSLSLLEKNMTPQTKVISISSVQFQTGVRLDLKKLSDLCSQKNILLFADITQGLGIEPISMKQLNLAGVASGSHKWLNAPVGVGFLAIKKELAIKMHPIAVGGQTYGECDDPSNLECTPKHNAFKFEPGAKQVLEICAMGKAVEIINLVRPAVLRQEAYRLAELVRAALMKMDFTIHSPFVKSQFISISPRNGTNLELQRFLHHHSVRVPIHGPGVRLTPHALNTDAEVAKLIEILGSFKIDRAL